MGRTPQRTPGLDDPGSRTGTELTAVGKSFPSLNGSLGTFSCRGCASSETESEAGDIMEQQLEEMNSKLNSVTDPTGFLRMVRRNNLFNRYVGALPWPGVGQGATSQET